jgi:cell shape-determining protein MreD
VRPLHRPLNAVQGTITVIGGLAAAGGLRLPVIAFSLAAVQALVIDEHDGALLRHLDLPLAAVAAIALTRPEMAVIAGFAFGLAIDSFHTKLFGLHCLAYCLMGPVASSLPVGGLRGRFEIVVFLVSAQTLVGIAVLAGGAWIADGHLQPGLAGRAVQGTLWTVVMVIPLTVALGGRLGLATPEPIDRLGPPSSADWR